MDGNFMLLFDVMPAIFKRLNQQVLCCCHMKTINTLKCSYLAVEMAPTKKKLHLAPRMRMLVMSTILPQPNVNTSFKHLGYYFELVKVSTPYLDYLNDVMGRLATASFLQDTRAYEKNVPD